MKLIGSALLLLAVAATAQVFSNKCDGRNACQAAQECCKTTRGAWACCAGGEQVGRPRNTVCRGPPRPRPRPPDPCARLTRRVAPSCPCSRRSNPRSPPCWRAPPSWAPPRRTRPSPAPLTTSGRTAWRSISPMARIPTSGASRERVCGAWALRPPATTARLAPQEGRGVALHRAAVEGGCLRPLQLHGAQPRVARPGRLQGRHQV